MANSNSKLFNLNWKEALRGLATAIVGAIITAIYTALQATPIPGQTIFDLDWKAIAMVGLAAGLGYIIQKFFRNTQDELFKASPK